MKTPTKGLLLSLVMLFVACGPTARETTLRTTLITVDTARDTFGVWDQQHQGTLIATAQTADEARASIASYREKRLAVINGFDLAYKAIAHAAILLDDVSIANALAAAADLKSAIEALGASWPKSKS